MKLYSFSLVIYALFNYFIGHVFGENDYYVIKIRRKDKDIEYDKASEKAQLAIDNLVNDRMNDIYEIINDNKETYRNDSGDMDEKLEELEETTHLRKRQEGAKFRFINKNRPQKQHHKKRTNKEEIPLESNLVIHTCPVSNYYVIVAYLSDAIVQKIQELPNVISCKKKITLKYNDVVKQNYKPIYTEKEILEETQWKGVSVQEGELNFKYLGNHLSLLSQGVYSNYRTLYDNNYYYPSSAGKGIDIWVMDSGINTLFDDETKADFDTYEGTPDERIIRCEGEFYNSQFHTPENEKKCTVDKEVEGTTNELDHGTIVSMMAVGAINGSAKKANLRVLASELSDYDILASLDYIKQQASEKPHQTILNMSFGCNDDDQCKQQEIQDKVLELKDMGVIIFVSAGNEGVDRCWAQIFEGAEGVIAIGSIANGRREFNKMDKSYKMAYYSNYGECVVGFAPGTLRTPHIYDNGDKEGRMGTSYASPLVAGMAATLMSDDPETEYNFETMRAKIIELSIEDVIRGVPKGTPNRLINNGKKTIYVPPKCSDRSGKYKCKSGCCSKFGLCLDLTEDATDIDSEKYCYIENGCRDGYGETCLTYDEKLFKRYKSKYQELLLTGKCHKEIIDHKNKCDFTHKVLNTILDDPEEQKLICDRYEKAECESFFKSPLNYAPTCRKINFNIRFDTPEKTFLTVMESAEQQIYCSKISPQTYCVNDNRLIYDTDYLIFNADLSPYCNYKACHDPLLQYVGNFANELEKLSDLYNQYNMTNKYEKYVEPLKHQASVLLSDKCISNMENVKPSTTTTVVPGGKKTKTNKTKANKTKSKKTKTNKTKANKTKSNKTKSNKTKSNKTKANKTKFNKTKKY